MHGFHSALIRLRYSFALSFCGAGDGTSILLSSNFETNDFAVMRFGLHARHWQVTGGVPHASAPSATGRHVRLSVAYEYDQRPKKKAQLISSSKGDGLVHQSAARDESSMT